MTEKMINQTCIQCDREFRYQIKTDECPCCNNGYHDVEWDYESAEDNMCGDGCMINGVCLECGATGCGEFSNKDVDFEEGETR